MYDQIMQAIAEARGSCHSDVTAWERCEATIREATAQAERYMRLAAHDGDGIDGEKMEAGPMRESDAGIE